MSYFPTCGPRKSQLSVVSLISSNNQVKADTNKASGVSVKQQLKTVCPLSLPTVADTDLLYKSIESAVSTKTPSNLTLQQSLLFTSRKEQLKNMYVFTPATNPSTLCNTPVTCLSMSTTKPFITSINNQADVGNFRTRLSLTSNEVPQEKTETICVPRGWNRIREKGLINYISPNKSRITCLEDMLFYLQYNGTCKCGLTCPLQPAKTFNFDPNVLSRFGSDVEHNEHCTVCLRCEQVFPQACRFKNEGRGRKPGKTKRTVSNEEKVDVPEKKKILLTSASPLSIFQTGMDAIKSATSTRFNNQNRPDDQQVSVFIRDQVCSPEDLKSQKVQNVLKLDSTSVEMPFPASLMGSRKRTKKSPKPSLTGQNATTKKKTVKKVLPNAAVHKASDLCLKDVQISQEASSIIPDIIPSLRNINNAHAAEIGQLFVTQQMGGSTVAMKLQDVYQHLTKDQALFTVNQANPVKSITSSAAVATKSVPPPNRTISAMNQLPKELMNQLSGHTMVTSPSLFTTQLNTYPEIKETNNVIEKASQPVNKPLSSDQQSVVPAAQKMVVVQLVSQSSAPQTSLSQVVNAPIVQTFAPQNFVHSQGQYVVVNNNAIKQSVVTKNSVTNDPKGLQIQAILHPQMGISQSTMPQTVQYVTALNHSIPHTPSYPLMQYIPTSQPNYIFPQKTGVIRAVNNGNYIRIAPATSTCTPVAEKTTTDVSVQDELKIPTSLLSAASTFFTNVINSSEKTTPDFPLTVNKLSPRSEQSKDTLKLVVSNSTNEPSSEVSLKCNENPIACTKASNNRRVGDIVWTQLSGYPRWPGKVISADTTVNAQPEDEQMLQVSLFGTNQVHLVHQRRLTSFMDDINNSEKGIDINSVKERVSKKQSNDLEKAIAVAYDEAARIPGS